jgi:hypothetical protein
MQIQCELKLNRLNVVIGNDENLKQYLRDKWKYEVVWIYTNPENNQHPFRQCKQMEEIVCDVNSKPGSGLVITNSSYMVDHLETLMAAYHLADSQTDVINKFILRSKDAFIKSDDVSVFVCEDDAITDGKIENKIAWDTFSNVSEWISDLYFETISKWYIK